MSQNKRDKNKVNQPSSSVENKPSDNEKKSPGNTASSQSSEGRQGGSVVSGQAGSSDKRDDHASRSVGPDVEKTARKAETDAGSSEAAGSQSGPKQDSVKTSGKSAAAPQSRAGSSGAASRPTSASSGQSDNQKPAGSGRPAASSSVSRSAPGAATAGGGKSDRGSSSTPPTGTRSPSDDDKGGFLGITVAIIALIVAVIALIGVGGLWYSGQQWASSLDSHLSTVAKGQQSNFQKVVMPKLSSMDDQINDMSAKVNRLDGALSQRQQRFDRLEKAVRNARGKINTLSEQLGGNHDRFVEQRISLLLEAANQRLQISHDPQGAIRALVLADQAIRQVGDPALHVVRKKITDEIGILKSLPDPDVDGMSLLLGHIIQQVPDLPLANHVPANYQSQENSDANQGKVNQGKAGSAGSGTAESTGEKIAQGWHQFVDSAGQALSKLVTVRKGSGASEVPPLMPPEQSYFLVQNLQLQLRTARLAMLGGHAGTYHDAIDQAGQWLKTYFDTDDKKVSTVLDDLSHLSQAKLAWKTPNISSSLDILRKIMNRKQADERAAAQSSESSSGAAVESGKQAGNS